MSVAGNGGACCECAALVGCDCVSSTACSLSCESKSGFATLCGHSEYTSPSNPRKLYRREALSGTRVVCIDNTFSACTSPRRTSINIIAGAHQYDKDTCAITDTRSAVGDQSAAGTGCTSFTPTTPTGYLDPIGDYATCAGNLVTATERKNAGGVTCGPNAFTHSCDGDLKQTLSDEDTEDDAENRAKAAITDWTGCVACACSAYRTDRSGTSDIEFGFSAVRSMTKWTPLPLRSYNITINFARRLLGTSGPFLDLGMQFEQTVTTPDATAIAANGGIWQSSWADVPNEAGWETIAYSCVVELIP